MVQLQPCLNRAPENVAANQTNSQNRKHISISIVCSDMGPVYRDNKRVLYKRHQTTFKGTTLTFHKVYLLGIKILIPINGKDSESTATIVLSTIVVSPTVNL